MIWAIFDNMPNRLTSDPGRRWLCRVGSVTAGRCNIMKTYAVYYRFTRPGEKKAANVTHYKLSAMNLNAARKLAFEQANTPGVELISVKEVD